MLSTFSVPVSWDELTPDIHSDAFTLRNLVERLDRLTKDPWDRIGPVRQSLSRTLKSTLGL